SRSYYLPITSGCSNNTCAFCSYYGTKLQIRDLDEIKQEIDALALYVKSGQRLPGIPDIIYLIARLWDGKGVFLQDGDALVYPFPKLKAILEHLNRELPSVERVAAYATAQDILRRSPDELKELKELKLGILYMGLESGDDEILQKIGKGVDSAQMIEAARKAKKAGILTSIMVILGLGGIENSERHALETARVLSEMDPDYVGALTLTWVPETPLYREWQQGSFSPISEFQSLKELLAIVENSHFTDCFFSSMHASNYFSIRGKLPREKAGMIKKLKNVIDKGDLSALRPESLRGL
ncbi:MAG: radical SAM protein, partial [Dehalococcoidales bacterium]